MGPDLVQRPIPDQHRPEHHLAHRPDHPRRRVVIPHNNSRRHDNHNIYTHINNHNDGADHDHHDHHYDHYDTHYHINNHNDSADHDHHYDHYDTHDHNDGTDHDHDNGSNHYHHCPELSARYCLADRDSAFPL